MSRIVGRLLAACVLLCAGSVQAQVVISEVYPGSTLFSPIYRSGFVELHNIGDTAVNLNGWSVQYANVNSASWSVTPLNGSIAPGGFYLVAQSTGPADSGLPATDVFANVSMVTGGGKVALVRNLTPIGATCTTSPGVSVADLIGWGGSFADCAEYAAAPGLNDSISANRIGNGCTDINNNSVDFIVGTPSPKNSQSAPQLCNSGPRPVLSISDASAPEGNGPGWAYSATFQVTLDTPAPPGGVRFNVSTSNGTATAGAANNPATDYFAQNWSIVMPEGATSQSFIMPIVGDLQYESDETIVITVSNIQGAIAGDDTAVYTILNDDPYPAEMTIAQVQGNGRTSAFAGQSVNVEGIVTAHRANDGFFLQSQNDDGNPATSEGIFVSTGGAPPASAAVGNRVRVVGQLVEFTPSNDLSQLSVTQIVGPTIEVLASGVPLPTPVVLTSTDFGPASAADTAEKYEGMRVSVTRARATEGSGATINEANASATNNGEFFVVLPDVARPFREPGIGVLDRVPIPADKTPPRFDINPERLMIRSRGQPGTTAINVDADAEVTGLSGVLDYARGTWALLPDPSAAIAVSGGKQPRAVADARADEITIASMNLRRFSDDIDDGNDSVQLTPAAFDKRLNKLSAAICDYLKAPDILGVQEVEHERALQALANRINSTCPRAPAYRVHLITSSSADVRNIGFLVSNRQLPTLRNRVVVDQIEQVGSFAFYPDPDIFHPGLVFERPPLRLNVTVNHPGGASYRLSLYLNHFSGRDGIDSIAPGPFGWATLSERVRSRRANQAMYLNTYIRQQQAADSNARIVVLGDFNAFDFSDGYVDVMGTLKGNPAPTNQVLTPTVSTLFSPMISGSEFIADPAERYSSLVVGTARTLEHILVNGPVVNSASAIRVDYARINADFAASRYGDANSAVRAAERDPVRMTIQAPEFRTADLDVTITAISPASPRVGQPFAFTVTVVNNGPSDAEFPGVSLLVFGPRTTSVNYTVSAPDGWSCGPSPISSAGFDTTAVCTNTSLAAGASASFTMSFVMTPEIADQTMQLAAAARTQTADIVYENNVFMTAAIPVIAESDLSVRWSGGTQLPLYSGARREFFLTMKNLGPDANWRPSVTFTADVPTGTVEIGASAWNCTPDYFSATVKTECVYSNFLAFGPILAGGETSFSVRVLTPLPDADGLNLSATVAGPGSDTNPANNRANLSLPLTLANADLSVQWTKVPAGPLLSGLTSDFALTLKNAGPNPAQRSSLIVTADVAVNDVSLEAPEGWACTPDYSDFSRFVAECVNPDTEIAAGTNAVFNLRIRAPRPDADGLNVSAKISSIGTDSNPGNNASARKVAVALANADLSAQWTRGPKGLYRAGEVGEFTLKLSNKGPDAAWLPSVTISVDVPFENVTFDHFGYWSCEADYSSANFKIRCSPGLEFAPNDPNSNEFFLRVVAPTRDKDKLNLSATITSEYIRDTNPGNNTATRRENINGPAK